MLAVINSAMAGEGLTCPGNAIGQSCAQSAPAPEVPELVYSLPFLAQAAGASESAPEEPAKGEGNKPEPASGASAVSAPSSDAPTSAQPSGQAGSELDEKERQLIEKLNKVGGPADSSDLSGILPKERQMNYHKDTDSFRAQVESPKWQKVYPDQPAFAAFARNYISHVHCDGVISDVIYPTTKGLELELKNGGHDLFISVGASVPAEFTHFPVDMHFICEGAVYQVNAVVDSKYTTTNLELMQTRGMRAESLRPYEDAVQRASALPYEEQVAKIMKRVWNNTPLPYWRIQAQNKSCAGSPCTLRLTVETGINGIVAWDFLAPRDLDVPELLAKLGGSVAGDIVSLGRVPLKQAQRVIILTRDKAGVR